MKKKISNFREWNQTFEMSFFQLNVIDSDVSLICDVEER